MKTVLFRAPSLTASGYGQHSRMVVQWLLKREELGVCKVLFDLVDWGMTPWHISAESFGGLAGAILSRNIKPSSRPDIAISLQLPNEWDPQLGNFNVGMTAAVETTTCNPEWIDACDKMDKIIVPSSFTKTVLNNTRKSIKNIDVVPESYDDIFAQEPNSQPFDFSTNFNFLLVGQLTGKDVLTDRKNIFNTVKWICETFPNNPNVGIVLKTNFGQNTHSDREITDKIMQMLVKEVRKTDFPKIHLIHGNLSNEEMNALYHHPKIKAFVTLSHGEGFGIPVLEAAVAGLPMIAVDWSGYTDFLHKGKFIKVAYNLQEVHRSKVDGKIFMSGTKWSQALESDFKKKLERFYESSTIPKQWATELKEKLAVEYSQLSIEKQYDEAFKGIL